MQWLLNDMKPAVRKLHNFFKLEVERGYDNKSVMGGLDRMLRHWEADAQADGLDEDLIQAVVSRVRDYSRLSPGSRQEVLEGLWSRMQRVEKAPSLQFEPPEDEITADEKELVPVEVQADSPKPPPEPVSVPPAVVSESKTITEEVAAPQEGETTPSRSSEERRPAIEPVATEPVALEAPVTVLPGVGPSNARTLHRLGLWTLRDMLYYFPRRYDDYSKLIPINRLDYDQEVTVIGTIQSINIRKLRNGRAQMVEVIISDGSGSMKLNWFNQVWVARRMREGSQVSVSGKVEQYLGRLVMNNPEWEYLDQKQLNTNRIAPVYPLTANLTQRRLRRLMDQVVTYWASRVNDPLPEELRQFAELVDLPTALLQVHFPDTMEDLGAARHRLAFDEIFLLQLGVLSQKRAWQERTARQFMVDDLWMENQLSRLPYTLTAAQQRVLEDLRRDLASGRPMNRLLQGDVGSGKTVVAALAVEIITEHSAQAALMAPTSILAEQHYSNLLNILGGGQDPALNPGEIRLLVGATPESEKTEIRAGLSEGTIKVLIGTHALIEDPINFKELQLVVVDEQHRFGVRQRASLRSKGTNPHLMVMTATPIPRSMALTVYGDLDLSIMDEMPPGRQPVSTHVLTPRELERAYSLIRSQVGGGRQAFIIYPLVEESEKSKAKAVVEEHEYLQKEIFPEFKLGLLHGRLRADEKERVMDGFRSGEYHILVSTTVVEVGVDVPNASVMLIDGANRYGLAQLHQLRGRVGRGSEKAYCLLVPDTVDELENERLMVMAQTNDGFVLAERDLEQRGPGEFLGTRQSGYSELQLASLTDVRLIEKARRFAQSLFESDPDLSQSQHQQLTIALERFWGGGEGDIS